MILVGDLHIAADRTRYNVLKVKRNESSEYAARYSQRLVHLIETVKWIDDYSRNYLYETRLAVESSDADDINPNIVQLGDIVSRATLDAEELGMIEEIKPITSRWLSIRGNHGIAAYDHDSDCAVPFERMWRKPVWEESTISVKGEKRKYNIVYLPYVLEKDRKPLAEYLIGMDRKLPTIILSHNDVKGMKYGGVEEKNGWSIVELEEWGDIILNAHIHNQQWVTDKILIVGNVDGENFNEDYRAYPHGIWILDEVAVVERKAPKECVKFVQNPYAMKFANVEIKNVEDIERIKSESDDRTILAITVTEELADQAQELIDKHLAGGKKIVRASKRKENSKQVETLRTENHIEKFKRSATEEYGPLEIINEI